MLLQILIGLLLLPAPAGADCRRHLLEIGPDVVTLHASGPFKRELRQRLEAYDDVTLEAYRAHSAAARLQKAVDEQRDRVTWLERVLLERRAWPLTRRAEELMRRHIALLESDRLAEATTARLRRIRASLENFVLENFAREDERVREFVWSRQDLDHAIKLARACREQIDLTEACAARQEITFYDPWLGGDVPQLAPFTVRTEIDVELAKLNRDLAALGAPIHNLGVRPGWDLPPVRLDDRFPSRSKRLRRLIGALEEELTAMRADFEARLRPLVQEALENCGSESCSL